MTTNGTLLSLRPLHQAASLNVSSNTCESE